MSRAVDRQSVYSCLRAHHCSVEGRGQTIYSCLPEHSTALLKAEDTQTVYSCIRAQHCFVKGRGQTDSLQLYPSTALLRQRPRTDRQSTAVSEHGTAFSKTEDRQSVYSCLRAHHCSVKGRGQTDSLQLSPRAQHCSVECRGQRDSLQLSKSRALLCQRLRTDIQSTAVSKHTTALSKAEDRQCLQLSKSTPLLCEGPRTDIYSCLRGQQCSVKRRGHSGRRHDLCAITHRPT